MKKNAGIKLLSAVVVGVVALILINRGNHEILPAEHQSEPNNMNAAIASQFNDNIRDVSARLLETQEKMLAIEKREPPKSVIPSEITNAIEQLKQELSGLKEARETTSDYPIDEPTHASNFHVHWCGH